MKMKQKDLKKEAAPAPLNLFQEGLQTQSKK